MVTSVKTLLLLNGIFSLQVCCQGSVPLADGTWLSSSRGTWTVNSTTIVGYSSSLNVAEPTSTLSYVSNTGTQYLFSTTTEVFSITITFYTCLDFQTSSTTVPVFYIITVFDSSVNDRFAGASADACTNTGYQTDANRNILVQQGAETTLTSSLPDVIRGEYSINFTSVSGVLSDGVTLDACNDTTVMRFNSTGSVQDVGFSTDGYLISLYSIESAGTIYLYTYNNDSSVDGSTTYRLVCWVITYSSFGVSASVYPGTCSSDQNATYTPTGGQLLALTPSYTCVPAEDSSDADNTLIIIIVVCVVVVVVIIIIVVIVIICCVVKKRSKKREEIRDDDFKKIETTRDVSVSTSLTSADSFCLPWLGRGTNTVSTSTTNLNSISFYMPLKYTKRPGDAANGAPASKRPKASTLQRSRTTFSTVDEKDLSKSIKQPVRFIQYVGIVKKDTKTKPVVNTRWSNGVLNRKETTTKTKETTTTTPFKRVQDELTRAKTFHDFDKEFEEQNAFPINVKRTAHTENKTTKRVTIGNFPEIDNSKTHPAGIMKVRSNDELDQIQVPDETNNDATDKSNEDKNGVYLRRSSTIPGIKYTSPYAMTKDQKEYFAKKRTWVTMNHNHEQAKQTWLKDVKEKANQKAYQYWIKSKTMDAENMRASLKRTFSQTSKNMETTL